MADKLILFLESGSPQGISTQLLTWQGKALKASGEKSQLFLSRFLIFRSGQVSKRIKDFIGFNSCKKTSLLPQAPSSAEVSNKKTLFSK